MYYESQLLEPLFEILIAQDFQQSVENLAGYKVEQMGKVIL